MKTAYLIYRPVMDYEESEESYLICSTKERAEEVRLKMIAFARILMESLESLYDDCGEMLPDDKYFEVEERNMAKLEKAEWPYSVCLSGDFPWRSWNERFNESCVEIRGLPFV